MSVWPRSVFEKIGLFDEELGRDQDDEFNWRLRAEGGKMSSMHIKWKFRTVISRGKGASMQNLRIHNLTTDDLLIVAMIHVKAFPDSALTRLGIEAIRRYYLGLLSGPYDSVCIGIFNNLTMMGFCFAGLFRGVEVAFLRRNKMFIIWRFITHPWLLTHEIVRNRVKYGAQAIKRYTRQEKERAYLPKPAAKFAVLSIAVDPQYQGFGVGRSLMQEVEISARQKKFDSMRLTVHPDNHNAVAFYKGLGWQKVLSPDGTWQGSMTKHLNNSDE